MQLWKSVAISAAVLGAASVAWAQDPAASQWQEVAASADKTYLADTANIRDAGDSKIVQVAVVPRTGAASDYSHAINQYAVRCSTNEFQVGVETFYGTNGAQEDRYADDAAPWDPIRPGSLAEGLKEIACDGGSSIAMPYDTVRAFIDGGRQ